ncbi:MAG: glycosyltransferase [Vicinamibacteria bacterium]|nr:glycosyltransferase [Vicinamibacteria bacterium]
MDEGPQLSAIVVVGTCRRRSQRVVTALCRQSAIAVMEVIVVDLCGAGEARLETLDGVRVVYLSRPTASLWSTARFEGLCRASAPVVAFIEDHCFPAPTWAVALIEAHQAPWVAVGYAFTNANPKTYISRGSMVNDYGFWLHPARPGAAVFLPGNNISYKRDVLLSYGDRLEGLLTPDFSLQEALARRGLPMCIEPQAMAAHQNFTRLAHLMRANRAYARLLAARRVRFQSWSVPRRVFYALVTPVSAPLLGVLRLLGSLRGRTSLLPVVLAGLPVHAITHGWSAWGEAAGYLFGEGSAEQELHYWEIEAEREAGG